MGRTKKFLDAHIEKEGEREMEMDTEKKGEIGVCAGLKQKEFQKFCIFRVLSYSLVLRRRENDGPIDRSREKGGGGGYWTRMRESRRRSMREREGAEGALSQRAVSWRCRAD